MPERRLELTISPFLAQHLGYYAKHVRNGSRALLPANNPDLLSFFFLFLLVHSEAVLSPVTPPAPWKAGDLVLNEPSLSFLATLASSSNEEIELQLQERMEFSKAAVSRIVEASDKIHRRTEELCQKIHARGETRSHLRGCLRNFRNPRLASRCPFCL